MSLMDDDLHDDSPYADEDSPGADVCPNCKNGWATNGAGYLYPCQSCDTGDVCPDCGAALVDDPIEGFPPHVTCPDCGTGDRPRPMPKLKAAADRLREARTGDRHHTYRRSDADRGCMYCGEPPEHEWHTSDRPTPEYGGYGPVTEDMIDRYIEAFVNTGDPDDPAYRDRVRQFLKDWQRPEPDFPVEADISVTIRQREVAAVAQFTGLRWEDAYLAVVALTQYRAQKSVCTVCGEPVDIVGAAECAKHRAPSQTKDNR